MKNTPANMEVIDPNKFGISFSIKQCHNFGLEPSKTLDWLISRGWRRFRIMTYWDQCESQPGHYSFKAVDWQLQQISAAGGVATVCLGVKQPRWPEYHWPEWVLGLSSEQRNKALLEFVDTTVTHLRDNPTVISWQLENEALLSNFGRNIDIDRQRLRQEFSLIKQLDISRPTILSTSNGWGIPIRRPIPDIVGISQYVVRYENGSYHKTRQPVMLHQFRKFLIRGLVGRPMFIHELQLEPWGPKPIWQMSLEEQMKSMSAEQITRNIAAAKRVNAYPIDCWGAEWWYWSELRGDKNIYQAVVSALK